MGCIIMCEVEKVEGIVLIPEPTRRQHDDRQLIADKNDRKRPAKWITRG